MTNQIQIQAPPDFAKRIIHFTTELLNRGWRVRDAVLEALKRTQDSYGADVEFRAGAEYVEKLVAYFEKAVESYRENQESGQTAMGHGLYAGVVSDDEFAERTKGSG